MPWTLYGYIAREVVKLLAISTVVLVLLISIAAAIKPMSDGLLGPSGLVKFVLYTTPTMLQFALPFAAVFASTLFFSRMTADNEVLVCSISGLSYRSILLPVMFLGLVLMLGLHYLSNSVVPRFNQAATAMLEKDIIRIMVSEVRRGRSVNAGNWVLYADTADEREPTEQEKRVILERGSTTAPFRVIMLRKVAISQGDAQGKLRREGTAETANILLFRDRGATVATLYLHNLVFYDAGRGDLVHVEEWQVPAFRLPTPLLDRPQFLSGRELRAIGQDPERYDKVRAIKQELVQAIAGQEMLRVIQNDLAAVGTESQGSVSATLLGPGDERYVIQSPQWRLDEQSLLLGGQGGVPVRVDCYIGGVLARKIEAQEAVVTARSEQPDPEPRATIELHRARVVDARQRGPVAEHPKLMLPRARWRQSVLEEFVDMPVDRLMELGEKRYGSVRQVAAANGELRYAMTRLVRDIIAQIHQRASAAVTCMFVVVLGAVMSMTMRGKTPLAVYFWGFMLTLVVVVVNQAGQTMCVYVEYRAMIGVTIIWLGNLLLLGAILFGYMKLARN